MWSTKYRYRVLYGDVRLRVRDIIRQVCNETGVDILHGVLSSDHVHMFVSVPPKLSISDLMRKMKGGGPRWELVNEGQKRYLADRIHLISAGASATYEDVAGAIQENFSARIFGSKRVVIEGAGHMVPISRAEDVAREISTFLSGVNQG